MDPRINQRLTLKGRTVFTMAIGQTYYQRDSMSAIVGILQDRRADYVGQSDAWYGEGRYMGD
mgnify:CR=1 FL=1